MCQQTPVRCCFDMISQTFTDPIAGWQGKLLASGRSAWGVPKVMRHPHPLGLSQTGAAH